MYLTQILRCLQDLAQPNKSFSVLAADVFVIVHTFESNEINALHLKTILSKGIIV